MPDSEIWEASGWSTDCTVKCGPFQLKTGLFCLYGLAVLFWKKMLCCYDSADNFRLPRCFIRSWAPKLRVFTNRCVIKAGRLIAVCVFACARQLKIQFHVAFANRIGVTLSSSREPCACPARERVCCGEDANTKGPTLTAGLWYVADGPKAASFVATASAASAGKPRSCAGLALFYPTTALRIAGTSRRAEWVSPQNVKLTTLKAISASQVGGRPTAVPPAPCPCSAQPGKSGGRVWRSGPMAAPLRRPQTVRDSAFALRRRCGSNRLVRWTTSLFFNFLFFSCSQPLSGKRSVPARLRPASACPSPPALSPQCGNFCLSPGRRGGPLLGERETVPGRNSERPWAGRVPRVPEAACHGAAVGLVLPPRLCRSSDGQVPAATGPAPRRSTLGRSEGCCRAGGVPGLTGGAGIKGESTAAVGRGGMRCRGLAGAAALPSTR